MESRDLDGLCLDVDGSPGRDPGTRLTVSECGIGHNNSDQIWFLGTDCKLRNKPSMNCMDVTGNRDKRNGRELQLDNCTENNDQEWALIKDEQKDIQIMNKATFKCVDVHGRRTGFAGSKLQQYTCEESNDTGTDQWWTAVPVIP